MPTLDLAKDDVAHRRRRLAQWIDGIFDGLQIRFIEDCAAHGHHLNQGEVSGLLKKKSFGEKKARNLERMARMPPRWLENTTPALQITSQHGEVKHPSIAAEPTPQIAPRANWSHAPWPFLQIDPEHFELLTADERAHLEAGILLTIKGREPPTKQHWPAPTGAAA